ncbi:GNAT family N-acetyltransferase [Priestia koreensis]|uniref:GNAT family N-acetyltransferase n=1 Tax=Priestia koreensis TaxID=284581 RepID=UPI0034576BB2
MSSCKRIMYLKQEELQPLLKESKEDGFRFLQRLWDDYEQGVNCFHEQGEVLMGVYNEEGRLLAIGGINRTDQQSVGRLRRFYVARSQRRKGTGGELLEALIAHATTSYTQLVLFTDTQIGDEFYRSKGFVKTSVASHVTHVLELK